MSMLINGNSALLWSVKSGRKKKDSVDVWKRRWLHWCRIGSWVCSYVLFNVDVQFVSFFEKLGYGKVLGKLFVATRGLAVTKMPPSTELIQLQGPFKSI